MRFWDSSAITPLLVGEADSSSREEQLREDPEIVVWFGSLAEIESAICRRERELSLEPEEAAKVRARIVVLAASWLEVQPTPVVRARAIRLLRVHPLRAADAFQLAAALIACQEDPAGRGFLTGDQRLARAAGLEGFEVG